MFGDNIVMKLRPMGSGFLCHGSTMAFFIGVQLMGDKKTERILNLYSTLINGGVVYKTEASVEYDVDERSIARDISDIREYLDIHGPEDGQINTVIFDRKIGGYRLEEVYKQKLSNPEVLAICKILLDSRSLTKKEMTQMLNKLIEGCVPKGNQKLVSELIKNEEYHYIEPHHKTVFIDNMWEIGKAINNHQYIKMRYKGIQGKTGHERVVKPLAIMFSDYYFYLAAFIDDQDVRKNFNIINDANPTIYRIDRIKDLEILDETFQTVYSSRFEEGEFKKRIQFMFPGALRKVKFEYRGYSVEAVLDRLPTATIIRKYYDDSIGREIFEIMAEVYGNGIDRWIMSQGPDVVLLK